MTRRRELIALLSHEPRSVSSIAREMGLGRGDAEEDLRHALRSAAAQGHRVTVLPARCKDCARLRPGALTKRRSCKGSRLFEPQIRPITVAKRFLRIAERKHRTIGIFHVLRFSVHVVFASAAHPGFTRQLCATTKITPVLRSPIGLPRSSTPRVPLPTSRRPAEKRAPKPSQRLRSGNRRKLRRFDRRFCFGAVGIDQPAARPSDRAAPHERVRALVHITPDGTRDSDNAVPGATIVTIQHCPQSVCSRLGNATAHLPAGHHA